MVSSIRWLLCVAPGPAYDTLLGAVGTAMKEMTKYDKTGEIQKDTFETGNNRWKLQCISVARL